MSIVMTNNIIGDLGRIGTHEGSASADGDVRG